MFSTKCFEPRGFILGIQLHMQYGLFHMNRREQSGAAHTDACETHHTAYTIESLEWNHEFRNI